MLRAQTVLRKAGRGCWEALFFAPSGPEAPCARRKGGGADYGGNARFGKGAALSGTKAAGARKAGGLERVAGPASGAGVRQGKEAQAGRNGVGKARMRGVRPRGVFLQNHASAKRPYVPQRWNFPAQQGDNPAAGPCAFLQGGHDFVKALRPEKNFLHVF